ncbi:MAG: peptidylprolyl isomerase [Candidatus Micrarchaeia archaeon]
MASGNSALTPKTGDFVKINYTGRVAQTGAIFDTTSPDDAKKFGVYDPEKTYMPAIVAFGRGKLLKGVENTLSEMKEGDLKEVILEPADAFGSRMKELVRVVPMSTFRKNDIMPFPGLIVELDGTQAIVKSVSAGRILVDFNHPLADEDVIYTIRLEKVFHETIEKVAALMEMHQIKTECEMAGDKLKVKFINPETSQEYQIKRFLFLESIKQYVPEIKGFEIDEPKADAKKEEAKPAEGKAEPAKKQ